LLQIRDAHPKIVVSMDEFFDGTNYQGIRHYHLRQFLLMTSLYTYSWENYNMGVHEK